MKENKLNLNSVRKCTRSLTTLDTKVFQLWCYYPGHIHFSKTIQLQSANPFKMAYPDRGCFQKLVRRLAFCGGGSRREAAAASRQNVTWNFVVCCRVLALYKIYGHRTLITIMFVSSRANEIIVINCLLFLNNSKFHLCTDSQCLKGT